MRNKADGCLFIISILLTCIIISTFCCLINNHMWWNRLKEEGYAETVLINDNAENVLIPIEELVPRKTIPKLPPGEWIYKTDDGKSEYNINTGWEKDIEETSEK